MVHSLPRYMSRWMPRVYGNSPGSPMSSAPISSGPYSGSMGTPEIVVNWRSATFIIATVILAPMGATKPWFLQIALMLKPTIFREYDIRGIADEELTDSGIESLGQAFGTYLQRHSGRNLTLGRDTRL